MRKGLFTRLALTNFKSNRRMYIPYLAACIGCVAMFYMMLFLVMNRGLSQMQGGDSLRGVLSFGCIIIAIFSAVIILYANSFLMKQRRRELGLYNILGMGKKHIARLMATETLYASLASMTLGLGAGILFSKLLLLIVCSMLSLEVPFGFEVSIYGVGLTLALFSCVFAVTLLWNISRVGAAKPVELLSSTNVGEREPRTKWVTTILGILTLGSGYAIAILTRRPSVAVALFFIAVILVIIGTYCLFTSGSIALLKTLKKRRSFYYTTRHFISVSSMIYRMKQNAVGLANICILSTMVLVMLSTTICLYYGVDDTLRALYPKNVEVHAADLTEETCARVTELTHEAAASSGIDVKNVVKYRYMEYWCSVTGMDFTSQDNGDSASLVYLLPVEDYNALTGAHETLEADEALYYSKNHPCSGATASLCGHSYRIVDCLDEFSLYNSVYTDDNESVIYIIVSDVEDMLDFNVSLNGLAPGEDAQYYRRFSFYCGMDTNDVSDEAALYESIAAAFNGYESSLPEGEGLYLRVSYMGQARENYYNAYGGLFFLGVFLALMFTCAAALIMYYKQISEGYDDRGRYDIMQKVGLTHAEVKASVRSQVLTVFFLPLVAAGIHVAFAFPLITVLFRVLALTNVTLFLKCTLGCYVAFAAVYAAVYALTARTYYKIVA